MVSAEVIRAALTFVERSETQNIQVEDLTSAAQVEYRTLLRAFKRYLRVTPKRYLKMRQLNLVRCALRTPEASSAMEVMADFGVTEFGRFATEYKRHFNELPSETLRGGLRGNLIVAIRWVGTDVAFRLGSPSGLRFHVRKVKRWTGQCAVKKQA